MTDKIKIKEEFDNFKSAYKNLEAMTEGMSEEELELIHKIQAVIEAHEDILENAAVEIIAHESEDEPQEAEPTEDVQPQEEAVESDAEEPTTEAVEEPAPEQPAPLPVPPVGNHKPTMADHIETRFLAWDPKNPIGRWIRRDRHNAIAFATMLMFAATMAWQGISYYIPETVTVTFETVANFEKAEFKTRATTVDAALKECGFDVADTDLVTPIREHALEDGMEIKVRHATNAKARIGGEDIDMLIIPGTVEDNLLLNDIKYDKDDIIEPSLTTKITEDTTIKVDYVEYKSEEKTETVKARSVVRLDPKLKSGVEEKVEGYDGKAVFEYKTKYVNGKKKGTEKEVKKWIKKVQDNELRLGTSLTGHKGEFVVEDEFTGNTTAYWMGDNARGASGGRCVYGTCAVDPKRIPYGTDMWIEGYGYAVANDCGSAIKNDHVDLWMHSYKESCQWGRRFVTVYVMKPVKK